LIEYTTHLDSIPTPAIGQLDSTLYSAIYLIECGQVALLQRWECKQGVRCVAVSVCMHVDTCLALPVCCNSLQCGCNVVAVWLQCGCSVVAVWCMDVDMCLALSVCYISFQCVAVWCSVVAVWLQCMNIGTSLALPICYTSFQCVAVFCSVVAVCCSACMLIHVSHFLCVAKCFTVLQCGCSVVAVELLWLHWGCSVTAVHECEYMSHTSWIVRSAANTWVLHMYARDCICLFLVCM